ncbi:MAG: hypothetical protein GX038_06935 [Erysipelothrix sp.]|nr:hypothetical protein [Erysipelothrix sp.]
MSIKHTVSLRLSDKDNKIIRNFAEIKGLSISEFLRESALNEIHRELDIYTYEEAYEKHIKKPKLISGLELRQKLGLV